MKYEKIKLTNGSEYEIVPGGLRESSDKTSLTIIALIGDKTLADVDSEFDTYGMWKKLSFSILKVSPLTLRRDIAMKSAAKSRRTMLSAEKR